MYGQYFYVYGIYKFFTDLVPMNNTVVRQIPANFYCRITDRTEVVSDIQTQWYINNIIHTEVIGLFEIIVNGGQAQTNLSIFSAFDTSIFVSCRSSFYPNTNLGVFQVGKCSYKDI